MSDIAGTARLEPGDCLDVMLEMAAAGEQFDSIVCDPPYDLVSVVRRFGSATAAPAKSNGATGVYKRASAGFMGQRWDGTGIAFRPETWRLAFDLLKPGGYLVAFGGTRTYHRMTVAIEDAGFEIRDGLQWIYGTGFPKSHDVSKAIDKAAGAWGYSTDGASGKGTTTVSAYGNGLNFAARPQYAPECDDARQWQGWGSALKPAFEPIVLARKPLNGTIAENVLAYGTGGLNIDGCRIGLPAGDPLHEGVSHSGRALDTGDTASEWGFKAVDRAAGLGRFPANVLHDGSPEVSEAFARFGATGAAAAASGPSLRGANTSVARGKFNGLPKDVAPKFHGDTGTAARFFAECPPLPGEIEDSLRFFYSGKANAKDRAGSRHPTVKPVSLMRWLCRLVTQPGGRILDPFAGSGSTLEAAAREGFHAIGIERETAYQADILRRFEWMHDPSLRAKWIADHMVGSLDDLLA